MIFCVKDYLTGTGIDKKKIHFELFTSPGQKKSSVHSQQTTDSETKSQITIKLDGRSFDFELSLNSDTTILDAALKKELIFPMPVRAACAVPAKPNCWKGK